MGETDFSHCHIEEYAEYADDDHSCFDYPDCKGCPYYDDDDKQESANMDELNYGYCHLDEYDDNNHDCLDYMECEECPYYYEDED